MYHTEPPTDKTIREWYMNSSRVTACALRNEQTVQAHRQTTTLNKQDGSLTTNLHDTLLHMLQNFTPDDNPNDDNEYHA